MSKKILNAVKAMIVPEEDEEKVKKAKEVKLCLEENDKSLDKAELKKLLWRKELLAHIDDVHLLMLLTCGALLWFCKLQLQEEALKMFTVLLLQHILSFLGLVIISGSMAQ